MTNIVTSATTPERVFYGEIYAVAAQQGDKTAAVLIGCPVGGAAPQRRVRLLPRLTVPAAYATAALWALDLVEPRRMRADIITNLACLEVTDAKIDAHRKYGVRSEDPYQVLFGQVVERVAATGSRVLFWNRKALGVNDLLEVAREDAAKAVAL